MPVLVVLFEVPVRVIDLLWGLLLVCGGKKGAGNGASMASVDDSSYMSFRVISSL